MEKDMKIQHSVSTLPYKVQGNIFSKKTLHWETNVLDLIYGGMFYMGTNDQIMQGGDLMVKRFQRSSQVSFPLIDPDLGYWYIIWKINTTNRGYECEKHILHTMLLGLGFHVKPVFCCQWWPVIWCRNFRTHLDLRNYGPMWK